MEKEPTIRELGERWMEASDMNSQVQFMGKLSLRELVEKCNLWDKTEKELQREIMDANPIGWIAWVASTKQDPIFLDLATLPRDQWESNCPLNIQIPQQFWDRLQGSDISTEELDQIAVEIERHFDFPKGFALQHEKIDGGYAYYLICGDDVLHYTD